MCMESMWSIASYAVDAVMVGIFIGLLVKS